jgi:hypothetical protein
MPAPLLLTYTVIGTGGLSPALPGLSNSPFWWIDTTGGTPAGEVIARGFTPFPAFVKVVDTLGAGGGGSLLLSSPFQVQAGHRLDLEFQLLKIFYSYSNNDMTAPLGFALLLPSSGPPVVLGNITAEDKNYFNNSSFLGSVTVPETPFAPPTTGVSVTTVSGAGLDVTLNGAHYAADPNVAGFCGCYLRVTSSFTPQAGTYQLLFGNYDFATGGPSSAPNLFRGALIINDVRCKPAVPSPPQNVRVK